MLNEHRVLEALDYGTSELLTSLLVVFDCYQQDGRQARHPRWLTTYCVELHEDVIKAWAGLTGLPRDLFPYNDSFVLALWAAFCSADVQTQAELRAMSSVPDPVLETFQEMDDARTSDTIAEPAAGCVGNP